LRLRLHVVPTARRHIETAAGWWRANRQGAPRLFREELSRAFDLITEQPDIAPIASEVDVASVRRFHLSRIRYHLYYRRRGDAVEVLALWHSSRGSAPEL
jgi:plasmid stabilization system protein ParE